MPASPTQTPTLTDYLAAPLVLGTPDVQGPLAVFPLFGGPPTLAYRSFSQAAALGASVKELADGASVSDLIVVNPTDEPVLLFEGEEVLGAQQNRTFDVSVLVAAGASLQVPVSCVEAGRWDGARHDESFQPAPQTAYPALRRIKNQHGRAAAAAGLQVRADQSAVWNEVAERSQALEVGSPTAAMHDIFDRRRGELDELAGAIGLRDGQLGTLVTIAGAPVVVDYVSRSDAFAGLHAPLVQGYALDALHASGSASLADPDGAQRFLDTVLAARLSERDGIGMGREVRFAEKRMGGAGLVSGTELVQLSAFADHPQGATNTLRAQRSRIRRPSQRRAD